MTLSHSGLACFCERWMLRACLNASVVTHERLIPARAVYPPRPTGGDSFCAAIPLSGFLQQPGRLSGFILLLPEPIGTTSEWVVFDADKPPKRPRGDWVFWVSKVDYLGRWS